MPLGMVLPDDFPDENPKSNFGIGYGSDVFPCPDDFEDGLSCESCGEDITSPEDCYCVFPWYEPHQNIIICSYCAK